MQAHSSELQTTSPPAARCALKRITFVWNADFSLAGGVRALKEAINGHHSCSLCAIAYHRVTQTNEWKAYKAELAERLGVEIREPCRDQLKKSELSVVAGSFPVVLGHTAAGVIKLMDSADIDGCNGEFAVFREKLDAAIRSRAA